jgi:hypothetical protein
MKGIKLHTPGLKIRVGDRLHAPALDRCAEMNAVVTNVTGDILEYRHISGKYQGASSKYPFSDLRKDIVIIQRKRNRPKAII